MINSSCELITNINKVHTTEMGVDRIKKNLGVQGNNIVEWCKLKILDKDCEIIRKGKNWYATVDNCIITVNAFSYTIITAHKKK